MLVPFSGWIMFIGLLYTTSLLLMNLYNPAQKESRVTIHCAIGKLTLASMLVHIAKTPFKGFNSVAIWSAVGLIFITVGTGLVLSYLPEAGKIRFHARSIHPALMVGIWIVVVHHILIQMGFI